MVVADAVVPVVLTAPVVPRLPKALKKEERSPDVLDPEVKDGVV